MKRRDQAARHFTIAGDCQLVPAAAGPGCVFTRQPPEPVRERQAVRAGPALHRLRPQPADQRAPPGVALDGFSSHLQRLVRCMNIRQIMASNRASYRNNIPITNIVLVID